MRDRIKDNLPRAIEAQILRQPLLNIKDIPHRLEQIARGGAGSVHIQHIMTAARLRTGQSWIPAFCAVRNGASGRSSAS